MSNMAANTTQIKIMVNSVTESLISTVSKSKPTPSESEIEFLRAYYHRLSGQDYSTDQASNFRNFALTHQQLGKTRKPNEIIVHLQNSSNSNGSLNESEQAQTSIYVISDNFPFIINSLRICLNSLRKTPLRTIHPVFEVSRNKNNIATGYRKYSSNQDNDKDEVDSGGVCIETFIHFLTDYIPENEHQDIARLLNRTLSNIVTVVTDWLAMKTQALEIAGALKSTGTSPEYSEYPEFIQWMTEDHFLFLGSCELELTVSGDTRKFELDQTSPLGVLRTAMQDGVDLMKDSLPPIVFTENSPVVFTKTRNRANIHKDRHMDCILVKQEPGDHDSDNPASKHRISCFLGFLAGSTSVLPTSDIPHIRKKASYVLAASTLRTNGYSYKELRAILETLPRDKLFSHGIKGTSFPGDDVIEPGKEKKPGYIFTRISAVIFIPVWCTCREIYSIHG